MIIMDIFNFCTEPNVLLLFLILKYAFHILCILLPIIIMYRIFVPMFKVVISGDKLTQEFSPIVKSILAALIIFFLPSIFSFLFTDIVDTSSLGVTTCFTNANLDSIDKYREMNEAERREAASQLKKDLAEASKKDQEERDKQNAIIQEYKDKKEEQERLEQEQQAQQNQQNNGGSSGGSSSGSANGNSGGSSFKSASKNIIIGDSRTVGMCATYTGNWQRCQYSVGGAYTYGNDIYIAEGSKGYSWFNSTAIAAVNSILNSNPNTTYNIYSLMGVNFLLSDINSYIPKYNSLASGSWKNHNIILVSVNPVDENKERQYGYSTKNSDIVTFNTKLKNGISASNIKYCDTYSTVLASLSTSDGLHYNSSSYKTVYNTMMSCGG